jgi:Domain of unknown function (DUF4845)
MRHRQRGVTFLGWIVLLVPVALVGYVALRAVPVYLNYGKVTRAFEQVRSEYSSTESTTRELIKSSLEKRFDVDYIESPKMADVSIRKTGEGWVLEVEWEDVVPLMYNASLLMEFEESVTIP